MKLYLKIYKGLLKANFSMLTAYRANFINSTVSAIGWGLFQIVWALLLTSQIKTAYGWTKQELILIAAAYVFLIGVFHLFFSRNFERMSLLINTGQLDSILLKPADSQFLLSVWWVNYSQVFRFVIGGGTILYLLNEMHITISFSNILGFLTLVLFGVIILYSTWLIVSTFLIWNPQLSNLVDLMYNVNGLARFPPEMIKELHSFIFLFMIPFTITVAVPTKVLIYRALGGDIFELIVISSALFFLSRWFWRLALRYYASASS